MLTLLNNEREVGLAQLPKYRNFLISTMVKLVEVLIMGMCILLTTTTTTTTTRTYTKGQLAFTCMYVQARFIFLIQLFLQLHFHRNQPSKKSLLRVIKSVKFVVKSGFYYLVSRAEAEVKWRKKKKRKTLT